MKCSGPTPTGTRPEHRTLCGVPVRRPPVGTPHTVRCSGPPPEIFRKRYCVRQRIRKLKPKFYAGGRAGTTIDCPRKVAVQCLHGTTQGRAKRCPIEDTFRKRDSVGCVSQSHNSTGHTEPWKTLCPEGRPRAERQYRLLDKRVHRAWLCSRTKAEGFAVTLR